MQYSGLLITCNQNSITECVRELGIRPGIDVYMADPATGRVVVVLETEDAEDQERQFRDIQRLSFVRSAELVYHYFGEPGGQPELPDRKASGAEN